MSIVTVASLLLLIVALATDLLSRTIPNRLTLPFFVAGMVFHVAVGGAAGLGMAIGGAAAGFLPLVLLYWLGGIGAGDVKLFGAAGAWIGVAAVLQLMMASIVFAGLIGLLLLALRQLPWEIVKRTTKFMIVKDNAEHEGDDTARSLTRNAKAKTRLRMPFMLAVAPAVIAIWPAFP